MPTHIINLAEAIIGSFYAGENRIPEDTYAELNALSEDERIAVMDIVYEEIQG